MKSLCAPLSRAPTCVHTPSQMTTARCRLTLPGHRGAHRGEHRCARHTFTDLMAALCRLFCGESPPPPWFSVGVNIRAVHSCIEPRCLGHCDYFLASTNGHLGSSRYFAATVKATRLVPASFCMEVGGG